MSTLPVSPDQFAANMESALTTIGSGLNSGMAGVQYMKVGHLNGAVVYGRDDTPVPLAHRFATPLSLMRWGFKVWEGKSVVAQVMEPIGMGPIPMPKTPYVAFGQNGPRKAVEVILLDLDEPGFNLSFGALSVSNENAVGRLVTDGVGQIRAGHADYANPVIHIVPQLCTYSRFGTTGWAFGHKLLDFVSNDGRTLWSKVKMVEDPAELPWDGGDPADPGERL
jgi:hypothetical protein